MCLCDICEFIEEWPLIKVIFLVLQIVIQIDPSYLFYPFCFC